MNIFETYVKYHRSGVTAMFSNIPIEKLEEFKDTILVGLKKVKEDNQRIRFYWRGPRKSKTNPHLGGGQAYCLKQNAKTFSVYIMRDYSK